MKVNAILLSAVVVFGQGVLAATGEPAAATGKPATVAAPAALPALKEGEHYRVINPGAKVDQPEVVEFFSYTCPHCRAMEGFLTGWKQQKPASLSFRRMHVYGMFGAQGDLLARAFYTAEVLGITEKMHQPLFDRVHLEHNPPKDDQAVAAFLSQFGVKEATVLSTMHSFPVNTKIEQAQAAMQKYRLRSVPSFILNDKYLTDGGMAKNGDMLNKILNELPLR